MHACRHMKVSGMGVVRRGGRVDVRFVESSICVAGAGIARPVMPVLRADDIRPYEETFILV